MKVWNNATNVEDCELAQEHGLSIITVHFKDHLPAGFLSPEWKLWIGTCDIIFEETVVFMLGSSVHP